MDLNNKKTKRTAQILLLFLVSVMLLMLTVSANPNSQPAQGNTALLGESGDSPSISVAIREEGSLQAGNLVLVLSVPDELYRIQMIAPEGVTTNRSLLTSQSDLSGLAALGENGNASTLSVDQQMDSVLSLGTSELVTETKFDAPVAGEYQFLLFDENDTHVGTKLYGVAYAGGLTIKFNDGKTSFDLHNTSNFILDYSTSNLEPEKLTLYLPPGYAFASKPATTSQYVVSDITSALPVEFYDNPNADILKSHTPKTDSNVVGIELAPNQGGTQAISFTFSIRYNKIVATNDKLARIMVSYGENPHTIPLNMGAKVTSLDGATTHATAMIEGVSDIVPGSGKATDAVPTFPHANGGYNPTIVINRMNPYFWNGILTRFVLDTPHYPITDIKFYMSVPEGTSIPVGTQPEIVDDHLYYVSTDPTTNLRHFTSAYKSESRNVSITPAHEALVPGHIYEMEQGFVIYTYKGQSHKSIFMPKTPVTVPQYIPAVNARVSSSSGTRVEQGTYMFYQFEFSNTNDNYLTPMYEDVKYTIDVPYGVKIFSTQTQLHTANNRAPLKNVEYYVDGDPTPRFLTIPDAATSATIDFPLADGEFITKLIYHYDKWNAFSRYLVQLNATAMTHERDGIALLPEEYPVTLTGSLSTRDNVAIQMSGTASPLEVPMTMPILSKANILYRAPILPLEDGLRFGSRFNGGTQNYTDREWTNYNDTLEESRIHFMFKSVTPATKDYHNVEVSLKPKTIADEAIFSWMTGLRTINFGTNGYSDKRDVYYTTNKNSWRLAVEVLPNAADTWHNFELTVGEFVNDIKIDVGTIYGSKFTQTGGADYPNYSGEGHATLNWVGSGMIFTPIMSHNYRNYFSGDPDREVKANTGDKWFMEAVVTIDGVAKYIMPGTGADPSFNTNKARGSLTLNTNWNFNMERNAGNTNSFYPSNKIYYQGSTFTLNYRNAGSSLNLYYPTEYEYNVRFYVSVHKYFDILSLTGNFQFQSVKDIPGSDYRLYTYKGKTTDSGNLLNTDFKLYVRPDSVASTALVVPINNTGISHDDFDRYLFPGHEDLYPYAKMSFVNMRKFPASWGIDDKIQYLVSGVPAVQIEMQMMDRIELLASSQGSILNDELTIYDHTKDSVNMHAFFGNLDDRYLEEYELELILPKTARDTPSIDDTTNPIPIPKINEVDYYLSGKLVFPDAPTGTTLIYYDLFNNVINMDTATLEEMRSVARIVINIKQFPPKTNLGITMPLYTDYEKIGDNVADLYSFVGSNRRKKVFPTDEWSTTLYTKAFPLNLSSYPLNINVSLDTNEAGQLTTPLAGAVETKVYYTGSSGDVLLYEGDAATHSIKVNNDVSHITVTPKNTDHYMLTLPNYSTNSSKNSNFPRTGRLDIKLADLIALTPNVHDAAFIIKPTLPVKDFIADNNLAVPRGGTVSQFVDFRMVTNGTSLLPARAYYTQKFTNLAGSTLVDLTFNTGDKKIYALGKELGSTTVTYTLINRLGDEFVVDGVKVNVVRNYVTKATIGKAFTAGNINLGGDTFSFNLWNEGTASAPANQILVAGVNTSTGTGVFSFVERGIKHYISEVSKAGYENDGFEGLIDGASIVFADEGGSVYSFTPPITANNVSITAKNKNATTDLVLRKELDAAALALNPNKEFTITVTEKNQPTPIVTATLKSGDSKPVPDLIFGRTYVVEETAVVDYALDTVTLEKNGRKVGAQPTSISALTYEFTLGLAHEGGEIVVYNQLAVGKGLEISKNVSLDPSLPREDYKFILTHPNGDVSYGLVPKTETTFPAKVKWYSDANNTVETDITELKIGQYVLEEEIGVNYELDEFNVANGTISSAINNNIIFVVTGDSALLKIDFVNKVKEGGQVSVSKIVDDRFLEDTMAFTIAHESSGRAFVSEAKVTSNNFLFSNWKENGVIIAANKLPFGKYTITESVEGYHYALKNFHAATGVVVAADEKSASFTLSSTFDTVSITAENKLYEKGSIRIVHVPNLDYGSVTLGSTIDVLNRTEDVYVSVENTLRLPTNWALKVSSNAQTTLVGGDSVALPYQMLKYSSNGTSYSPLSSQQLIMNQDEPKVGDLHRQDWLETDSSKIVAQILFRGDIKASGYQSDVTWTLELVP